MVGILALWSVTICVLFFEYPDLTVSVKWQDCRPSRTPIPPAVIPPSHMDR